MTHVIRLEHDADVLIEAVRQKNTIIASQAKEIESLRAKLAAAEKRAEDAEEKVQELEWQSMGDDL